MIGRKKHDPLRISVHHSRKVKERIHHHPAYLHPSLSFSPSLHLPRCAPLPVLNFLPINIPLAQTLTRTLDSECAPFSSELSFSPAETHDSGAPLHEVPSHPNIPASCRGKITAIRMEGGMEGERDTGWLM